MNVVRSTNNEEHNNEVEVCGCPKDGIARTTKAQDNRRMMGSRSVEERVSVRIDIPEMPLPFSVEIVGEYCDLSPAAMPAASRGLGEPPFTTVR
jgi:hypothetical protein